MNEFVYRLFKKNDVKSFYRESKKVDYFVLLTEQMKDRFPNKPYTVVECIADPKVANYETGKVPLKKSIVYTGTIHNHYGLSELIQSMEYIEEEGVEIVICGDGPMREQLIEIALTNSRVKYLGNVSQEDAIAIQRDATILINPRDNDGEYTKFSFPSKTLEYMLAAKPVLCHKLDGIPDEYDDYLFYLESNEPKHIAKRILEIINLSDAQRVEIGEKARDFAVEQKSYLVQTKKIIKLLKL
ncbi:MAG: glycosyltransferase [Sphaerochaetaceae bacterium]